MLSEHQIDEGLEAVERLLLDGTQMIAYALDFLVMKSDGNTYKCSPTVNDCTCPAHGDCKHLKAGRVLHALCGYAP